MNSISNLLIQLRRKLESRTKRAVIYFAEENCENSEKIHENGCVHTQIIITEGLYVQTMH
jgi:hypothetical protein